MRPLGVGLVYLTELDDLFREGNPNLTVLELEPQTLWEKAYPAGVTGGVSYFPNVEAIAGVAALPQHKLVHSVGFPIGGSVSHEGDYVAPLTDAVTTLDAVWASEHLSFNSIHVAGNVEQLGFLLPPRQTMSGVRTAVNNIRRLASQLPVPFAFETGVNYLQSHTDELSDGEFFAAIADQADCGILLDLHNLWVNERNGRQQVTRVVDELPLDRVWEVHLAGGMMLGEYYLDSHSEIVPAPLLGIATEVIPRLPNLGALIFEVLPGYVSQLGLSRIKEQLAVLNDLWGRRPPKAIYVPRRRLASLDQLDGCCDVVEWEQSLGMLAIGHSESVAESHEYGLASDEGVNVLRTLIGEFRDGRIARTMRFTMTLLLTHLGADNVRALLSDYHANTFPDTFTSGEADRFAQYLRGRMAKLPSVPFLAEVLNFEHALIRAALYGEPARIEWDVDPTQLFDALEAGRIPSPATINPFTIDIVPEP